ncbi:MAG: Uracil-DNA glycosylase, family 4 [Candidatus Saccharicenans subterraneus]|uniref:Type-4 uracil-DNA glycosylase n=1 Tax=Candidatus Saccharicenans subterraneus TaxID=2508984 RepID=A0A3E2BKX1_9BACT|nr:MAG: Uracil-DNA glycosylase, family 4 [Candidatus Saccharicenans subterraneum]
MNEKEKIDSRQELKARLEFFRDLGVEFLVSPRKKAGKSQTAAVESPLLIAGGFSGGPATADSEEWERLIRKIMSCQACPLFKGRTQAVPGEGNRQAKLMFVGEAPGRDEDLQGRPFVGRAGQLLTKIIQAMGFSRDQVYIANVIKCRPPENRTPRPDEVKACSPYLLRQIELIKPRVIVALGKVATDFLLQSPKSMSELRGNFGEFQGIPVMPTFHPSYLVRNEGNKEIKKMVWEDMKKVLKLLES